MKNLEITTTTTVGEIKKIAREIAGKVQEINTVFLNDVERFKVHYTEETNSYSLMFYGFKDEVIGDLTIYLHDNGNDNVMFSGDVKSAMSAFNSAYQYVKSLNK